MWKSVKTGSSFAAASSYWRAEASAVSIAAGSMSPCLENSACHFGRGCLECGMARITPRSQAFVKFLAV